MTVAKINIDENPETPTQYGVRGIPTLMLFKNGQVAATKVGALPKSELYQWVQLGDLSAHVSFPAPTQTPVPTRGEVGFGSGPRLPGPSFDRMAERLPVDTISAVRGGPHASATPFPALSRPHDVPGGDAPLHPAKRGGRGRGVRPASS